MPKAQSKSVIQSNDVRKSSQRGGSDRFHKSLNTNCHLLFTGSENHAVKIKINLKLGKNEKEKKKSIRTKVSN